MAGLNEKGFQVKSFGEIKEEVETAFRDIFRTDAGDEVNLESTSLLGQTIGIFTKQLYDVWELSAAIYQSRYPQTADGLSLDGIASLAGLERQRGSKTSGVVYLTGQVSTVVPQGTTFSNETGFLVETQDLVVLSDGVKGVIKISRQPGNSSTAFIISITGSFFGIFDDLVGNSATFSFTESDASKLTKLEGLFGSGKIDTVETVGDITTITFADNNWIPPIITVDATLAVSVIGLPDGAAVGCQAQDNGNTPVAAGDITVISTPITGLTSVINIADFITGRFDETDRSLRERWFRRVETSDVSSLEAIRAKVANLQGVLQSEIEEGRGSFETVVNGGDPDEIAKTIFETKPAGVGTTGTVLVFVNDERNVPKPIRFSRPIIRSLLLKISYQPEASFSENGESEMLALIDEYVRTLVVGATVRPVPDIVWALKGVQGIASLTISIGEDEDSLSTNSIQLDSRETLSFYNVIFEVVSS